MKLDAAKFHKFLKKASLNYFFTIVKCEIGPSGIVSEMSGMNSDTALYVSIKNKDGFTGVKKPESVLFPIKKIKNTKEKWPGLLKVFFKGDKNIYDVKRENKKDEKTGEMYPSFICILPDGTKKTFSVYGEKEHDVYQFKYAPLKPVLKLDIEKEFLFQIQNLNKLSIGEKKEPRGRMQDSDVRLDFDHGKVSLSLYNPTKQSTEFQTVIGKIEGYFGKSICELNAKLFSKVIQTIDKKGEYTFSVMFDQNTEYAYISIDSKDKSEKYILLGKKVVMGEVVDISKADTLPVLADKGWNYQEAVGRLKGKIFAWKKMTEEMYAELCLARKMLALSKADAARIKHGLISPTMTWTSFCEEIGSTRQSVDRWLEIWEGKKEVEASDTKPPKAEQRPSKTNEIPGYLKSWVAAGISDDAQILVGHKIKSSNLHNEIYKFGRSLNGNEGLILSKPINSDALRDFADVMSFKHSHCLAFKGKVTKEFIEKQKELGALVFVKA
jgi:hypothetical protein